MEYFAIAFFVIIAGVILFKRSPKPTTTAVVAEPTEAELAVAPVVETAVEIIPAGTEATIAAPAKKPRAKKAASTTATKKPRAKKAAE